LEAACHIRQSEYNIALEFIFVKAYMKAMDQTALFFTALADMNRLRLLNLMREGEVCVCFLHVALNANQPRVSRHLAYLRHAGLVEARREGKWQYYQLKLLPKPLQRVLDAALDALETDQVFKKDKARVKQICCSPGKFGLPEPMTFRAETKTKGRRLVETSGLS